MKNLVVLLFCSALLSCGDITLQTAIPAALAGKQPTFLYAEPDPADALEKTTAVTLYFSQALDPSTIGTWSLPVLLSTDVSVSMSATHDAWLDGAQTALDINYAYDDVQYAITLEPVDVWPTGQQRIVISNALYSHDGLPFAQYPQDPTRVFAVTYERAASEALVPDDATSVPMEEDEESSSDEVAIQAEVEGAPRDDVSDVAPEFPEPVLHEGPSELLINEILYDIPGSDTNGELFVELRGTPHSSLAGAVVRFLNGDGGSETGAIVLPASAVMPDDGIFVIADAVTGSPGVTNVSGADYVANFDPQNGPDAVQVLAADGALFDALGYGTPLPLHDADGFLMYEGEPAPDVNSAESLSRMPDEEDTHNNANDFVVNIEPSPGALSVVRVDE